MKKSDCFYISALIASRLDSSITPDDETILDRWLAKSENNRRFYSEVTDGRHLGYRLKEYDDVDLSHIGTEVISRVQKTAGGKKSLRLMRTIAAAAVLLLAAGSAFWLSRPSDEKLIDNIVPGLKYAILETSEGQRHELRKDGGMSRINEGEVDIDINEEGLIYENTGGGVITEVRWNRIVIPRGVEYMIRLSDGSRVRLNSDSELRYPAVFIDNAREVYLTGEAYFEVEPLETEFVVHAADADVRVLGTSFNVMNYPEEPFMQTTLVSGSVEVAAATETVILSPGQQAVVAGDGKITVNAVDAASYKVLKENTFVFDNENLGSIMRKLSRWYDVEIVIKSQGLEELVFYGVMRKHENISKMLDMISKIHPIEYRVTDERVITITSKR